MSRANGKYEYCVYPCMACGVVISRISEAYGDDMPDICDAPNPVILCDRCRNVLADMIYSKVMNTPKDDNTPKNHPEMS